MEEEKQESFQDEVDEIKNFLNNEEIIEEDLVIDVEEGVEEDVEEEEEDVNYEELYREGKKKIKSMHAKTHQMAQSYDELANNTEELKSHYSKEKSKTNGINSELLGRNLNHELAEIIQYKELHKDTDDPRITLAIDKAYSKALYDLSEFESLPDAEPPKEEVVQQAPSQVEQVKANRAKAWINSHPEFITDSYSYDKKLTVEVGAFMENLNSDLISSGDEDSIQTKSYFAKINSHIAKIKDKYVNKSGYKTSNVGSVNNKFSTSSRGKVQMRLSSKDKEDADRYGSSHEEWLAMLIDK